MFSVDRRVYWDSYWVFLLYRKKERMRVRERFSLQEVDCGWRAKEKSAVWIGDTRNARERIFFLWLYSWQSFSFTVKFCNEIGGSENRIDNRHRMEQRTSSIWFMLDILWRDKRLVPWLGNPTRTASHDSTLIALFSLDSFLWSMWQIVACIFWMRNEPMMKEVNYVHKYICFPENAHWNFGRRKKRNKEKRNCSRDDRKEGRKERIKMMTFGYSCWIWSKTHIQGMMHEWLTVKETSIQKHIGRKQKEKRRGGGIKKSSR